MIFKLYFIDGLESRSLLGAILSFYKYEESLA